MINFSRPLWTAKEMALALNLQEGQPFLVDGITLDSRQTKVGDLFVAIKGDRVDGHDYVAAALQKGASKALVGDDFSRPNRVQEDQIIRVQDPLAALNQLAVYARRRAVARRIGVTGSVGKTSLVHALRDTLSLDRQVHASERSFNNHIGVPLTLARLGADTPLGVFEMGMNQAGEIHALSDLVQPDIAIITAIAPAHIGQFSGLSDIADAKAEIFNGMASGATAIIGMDHDFADTLIRRAETKGLRVITVSAQGPANVCLKRLSMQASCSSAMVDICGTRVALRIGQPGRPALMTALFTLATAMATGCDLAKVSMGLGSLTVPPGRGRLEALILRGLQVTLIDDSYNANPASFAAALNTLDIHTSANKPGARVHIVAGDMLELGEFAPSLHDETLTLIAEKVRGDLLLAGPNMLASARRLGLRPRFQTDDLSPDQATNWVRHLKNTLRDGDTLLVKGSHGSRVGLFVDAMKQVANAGAQQPDNKGF